MNKIHERIKYLRTQNKLTQKKLAEIAGVQEASFQRFEYGTLRPSLDTLWILANYFDVSLDYLVGRTEKPEVNK